MLSAMQNGAKTRWVIPETPPPYKHQPCQLQKNITQANNSSIQQTVGVMNRQAQPEDLQQSMSQNTSTSSNSNLDILLTQSITFGQYEPSQPLRSGRLIIWAGVLEWNNTSESNTDHQKIKQHIPFSVSADVTDDGGPEVTADLWPQKLIIELVPEQLIENSLNFKNLKIVQFQPTHTQSNALESLKELMSNGFAACVYFTSVPNPSVCDIKVLVLLYVARVFHGCIPNDQEAFFNRLRNVMGLQKYTQMTDQAGTSMNAQSPMPSTSTSEAPPPQELVMPQTSAMTISDEQITQNATTSTGQPIHEIGGPMQHQMLKIPGMQQMGDQLQNHQQQLVLNPNVPRADNVNHDQMMGDIKIVRQTGQKFPNHLEVDRQTNLDKINQLKQSLEAAQKQDQQYNDLLELISHIKTE